jgi:16S rRNA (guanine527-N7)-methyltransferase
VRRPPAELPPAAAELPPPAREQLASLVDLLARERRAPSAVREPPDAWRVHVADSLSGLVFDELRLARGIADLGAGAGFPGLVLAAALPSAAIDLIESLRRKCEFMRLALTETGIANARVVCERAEEWAAAAPPAGGREVYEAATARAVGRLATLAELASPLLAEGGALIAWKGRRREEEEEELARARERVGMELRECRWVGPYAGSRNRHLYLIVKVAPTPRDLPRRPGMAAKRPFGGKARAAAGRSGAAGKVAAPGRAIPSRISGGSRIVPRERAA